jgi:hypothetical protein
MAKSVIKLGTPAYDNVQNYHIIMQTDFDRLASSLIIKMRGIQSEYTSEYIRE